MTSAEFRDRLLAGGAAAGVSIAAGLLDPLEAYYRLLVRWNEKINLTAVDLRELPSEGVNRLFIEPVAAARYALPGSRVIDIGSGGGSPAIPFALAAAAEDLKMVEARSRKSAFLQEAVRAVGLGSGLAITARFEDLLTRTEFSRTFDIVTIRAVRLDSDAVRDLGGFLKPAGSIFLFQRMPFTASIGELTLAANHPLTETSSLAILTSRAQR